MKCKPVPVLWIGVAFGVALGLAAIVLVLHGTGMESLVMALRLTARWSFLLFWIAYAGGALFKLFGSAFKQFAGRGREFGLAYAVAQTVHLGLVVWLFQIAVRPPLAGELFAFFVIGIVWTYLLAVLSFGDLTNALGPRVWRALRFVGLNYILFAFAFDFVPAAIRNPAHYGAGRLIEYAPFALMCFAAPALVAAAAVRHRIEMRYRDAGLEPVIN
jgi:hypothetical protein